MKALLLLPFALSLIATRAIAGDVATEPILTLDGARSLAESALNYAHAHGAPGAAIAVVDAGGIPLYVERIDGTFRNAANISLGKARTAVLFGKPTRVFEDLVNKGRYTMLALPDIAPFTPLMGGVPIEIDGQVAGAIGVSGAASAAQDDEIATAAAAEFMKKQNQLSTEVTVVPRATVDAGFAKDTTLLRGQGFRVEASHRTGQGQAEVHMHDTDIFYVLKGRAHLVVGGTVIEPQPLSEGEVRGSRIEGGEQRVIADGDVVVIPRGVPHWFTHVDTPFRYYVVKSSTP